MAQYAAACGSVPSDRCAYGARAITSASLLVWTDAAARFVALVDTAYDHRVRLFTSARGQPADLFAKVLSQAEAKAAAKASSLPPDALVDDNLAFAKERTISRLIEMQSLSYLMDHARLHAPVLLAALEELREKEGTVSLRKN